MPLTLRRILFVLGLSLLKTTNGLNMDRRAGTELEIVRPRAGESFVLAKINEDISIPIEWTVPEALAERPATISLMQGNSISSLELAQVLNASAPNNGSYTVYPSYSNAESFISGFSFSLPSGCNYSIEIKVWSDVVYSGYFTLINPKDGGVNKTAVCPSPEAQLRPQTGNFVTGEQGDRTPSSGVSTTMLAVAVAVPIVVLLVSFALILWLGRRKGWFVRKSHLSSSGSLEPFRETQQMTSPVRLDNNGPGELEGRIKPHQLLSTEIYQLHGDESVRR